MRYQEFKIVEAEDPNAWSQKDLGSVIDWINLHNAAFEDGWDMPIDDPIVILGLVGDPALGIMDDWKAFAGDTPKRDTRIKGTRASNMKSGVAAFYDTSTKELNQNAALVDDRVRALADDYGLVHESMHRALDMIRELLGQGLTVSSEAKKWLTNETMGQVGNVQYSVDHCMIYSILHSNSNRYQLAFLRADTDAKKFFNSKWQQSFNDNYVDLAGNSTRKSNSDDFEKYDSEEPITEIGDQMSFYFAMLYTEIGDSVGKYLKTPQFTPAGAGVRPRSRPQPDNPQTTSTISGNPSAMEWLDSIKRLRDQKQLPNTAATVDLLSKDIQQLQKRFLGNEEPKIFTDNYARTLITLKILKTRPPWYAIKNTIHKKLTGKDIPRSDLSGRGGANHPPTDGSGAGAVQQYVRSIRDSVKAGTVPNKTQVVSRLQTLTQADRSRVTKFVDQLLATPNLSNREIDKGIIWLTSQ